MENKVNIAIAKGRVFAETLELWQKANLSMPREDEKSRKLVLTSSDQRFSFILAKPSDVPTYVEYGVADIGVVGKDILLEVERDLYELLDLQIGKCRLSLAGLPENKGKELKRIATKYPAIANRYFRSQGRQVEVITLNGSVELAPILGLAEGILDIVSTGQTLKENGLSEYEVISEITTRLIANRVKYRTKYRFISEIVERLAKVLGERE